MGRREQNRTVKKWGREEQRLGSHRAALTEVPDGRGRSKGHTWLPAVLEGTHSACPQGDGLPKSLRGCSSGQAASSGLPLCASCAAPCAATGVCRTRCCTAAIRSSSRVTCRAKTGSSSRAEVAARGRGAVPDRAAAGSPIPGARAAGTCPRPLPAHLALRCRSPCRESSVRSCAATKINTLFNKAFYPFIYIVSHKDFYMDKKFRSGCKKCWGKGEDT